LGDEPQLQGSPQRRKIIVPLNFTGGSFVHRPTEVSETTKRKGARRATVGTPWARYYLSTEYGTTDVLVVFSVPPFLKDPLGRGHTGRQARSTGVFRPKPSVGDLLFWETSSSLSYLAKLRLIYPWRQSHEWYRHLVACDLKSEGPRHTGGKAFAEPPFAQPRA